MTFKLLNRVRMSVIGAAGTGDLTLNLAAAGFQDLVAAGIADGDTFPYVIEDGVTIGTVWEIGLGTYHSNGTVTRTTVTQSSVGGTTKISATSTAILSATVRASDVPPPYVRARTTPVVVQYGSYLGSGNPGPISITLGSAPTVGNYLIAIVQGGDPFTFGDWLSPPPADTVYGFSYGIRAVRSGDSATQQIASPSASQATNGVLVEVSGFDPAAFGPMQASQATLGTGSDMSVFAVCRPSDLLLMCIAGDQHTVTDTSPALQFSDTQTSSHSSALVFGYATATKYADGFTGHAAGSNMTAITLALAGVGT